MGGALYGGGALEGWDGVGGGLDGGVYAGGLEGRSVEGEVEAGGLGGRSELEGRPDDDGVDTSEPASPGVGSVPCGFCGSILDYSLLNTQW